MSLSTEQARFERLSRFCLALPEAVCNQRASHAEFRVRKRVFAYYLNNHHGDGIVSVCCKSVLGEHTDRVRRDPERCYLPAYIGKQGWFAIRLDQESVDWQDIESALIVSYSRVAPKTLVARMR